MIAYLRGYLIGRFDTMVTVDVGGVGYGLYLCDKDLINSTVSADQQVVFWVHTYYSQDQLKLYGFISRSDRDLFVFLLALPAVGPKLALAILARLSAEELASAVQQGHLHVLRSVDGIGHKKAQTLMIELQARDTALLALMQASSETDIKLSSPQAPGSNKHQKIFEDVHSALTHLGVSPSQATQATQKALVEGQIEMGFEHVFKQALSHLGPS